jgi:hypothetical protein
VAIAGIHFVTVFAMVVGSLVMGELDETKVLLILVLHHVMSILGTRIKV